ncbi:MAG: TolB family protein, partial [bacterium]
MFYKILQIVCFFIFLLTTGCDQNKKDIVNPSRPGPLKRDYGGPVWGPTNLIIFRHGPSLDSSGIWLIRSDGTGKRPFWLHSGFFNVGDWSPDGRWLALDEDGQIYRIRIIGDSLEQLTSGSLRKFFPTWS